MLVVRYLIALVFSIFMVATSLRIEERYRRSTDYKISTPDRLVLQMDKQPEKSLKGQLLQGKRLNL